MQNLFICGYHLLVNDNQATIPRTLKAKYSIDFENRKFKWTHELTETEEHA